MRNDFAIQREQRKDGKLFLYVDTKKAILRGMKWEQLGDYGKRKLENLLFLSRIAKEYIVIKYV